MARIIGRLLRLAKKIPFDLGQEAVNRTTKGKKIALSLVPQVPLPERGKRTALDVGCRKGYQTLLLERGGYKVTPIDVEKVFYRCRAVDANKSLPFAERSFDLIWCSEVIEHLVNPAFTVAEFRRVLKPGGKMILTTPNSYFWLMKPLHWIGLSPKKLQRPDHTQFFHEKDIRRLFPRARVYGFFPYLFFKVTIDRLLGALTPTFVISERKPERKPEQLLYSSPAPADSPAGSGIAVTRATSTSSSAGQYRRRRAQSRARKRRT